MKSHRGGHRRDMAVRGRSNMFVHVLIFLSIAEHTKGANTPQTAASIAITIIVSSPSSFPFASESPALLCSSVSTSLSVFPSSPTTLSGSVGFSVG